MTLVKFFTEDSDTFTIAPSVDTFLTFLGGNDSLTVKSGPGTLTASMGDGNDKLILKDANATVYGEAGDDRFDFYVSAVLRGGSGNDVFNLRGGTGANLDGGAGADLFNFYADSNSFVVSGGDGNDKFHGFGHSLTGGITGGAGNDYFDGFTNTVGTVTLYGGTGNDIYRVTSAAGPQIVEFEGQGVDTIQLASGLSYVLPNFVEKLTVVATPDSTSNAATITGNDLDNLIVSVPAVALIGGGAGADSFYADAGADTMFGGAGADGFFFTLSSDSYPDSPDQILDFVSGTDKLNLFWIDADTGTTEDQAFTIVDAFDGGYGRLTITLESPDTYGIRGDVNGDSVADFLILVHSATAITADDIGL